jgi:hypothetical protein
MLSVRVTIAGFIDEHQPGWVECLLVDVHGRTWKIHEKIPVVSSEDLTADSKYPKQGIVGCTVLARTANATGREVVTIGTERPWGIESIEGNTVFEVFAEQLESDQVEN